MEEKLINFMKTNDFIHNINSPEYKNVIRKERKWKEIANELNQDVQVVKMRWKTLRDKFHREDQRIKVTGCGINKRKNWKYYDKMIFLRNSKKKTEQKKNVEQKKTEKEIFERIISFMKKNDFLHNINSLEYKNIKAKEDKWLHLSYSLGLTVKETKRRWNILKTLFYNEEQRLNNNIDSEDCTFENYEYYEDLIFLRDSKKTNAKGTWTESNITDDRILRKIIEFVKENNFINNKNEYKEFKVSEPKWQELANRLELNVNQIKQKWKLLTKRFHFEYDKICSTYESNKHISKWKYFEDLKFLSYSKKLKKNVKELPYSLFEEVVVEDQEDISDESYRQNVREDSFNNSEQYNGSLQKENKLVEKDFSTLNKYDFTQKMNLTEKSNILEKSAIILFFESIAFTVANANLPISETLNLQMSILNLITKRITTNECKNS